MMLDQEDRAIMVAALSAYAGRLFDEAARMGFLGEDREPTRKRAERAELLAKLIQRKPPGRSEPDFSF